jgi:hypothetical protein
MSSSFFHLIFLPIYFFVIYNILYFVETLT